MTALRRFWTILRTSVFRVGIPRTNLGRAQAMVSSFVLHLHPAKVRRESLRPTKTFGLGLISLYLFIILIVTGVLLMFDYVPSVERAYDSMKDLEFVVTAGVLLRNCHRWAAHLMVVAVLLHMARVFLMGSYKRPREFNWLIGIALLLLTLFLSFTGYLLPWDQLAFWAITVGTSIAGYAPVVGDTAKYLLLGGNVVGQPALLRFYVLHVVVLPAAALFLVAVHLYRIRKDGGLARPGEDQPHVEEGEQPPPHKSYGLMALTEATTPHVGSDPEEEVFSWPHLLMREILLFAGTFGVVLLLAILFNAPLEEVANPVHPPNPAKAPWYFLALQELVAHSAFLGGVLVPGLLVALLIAVPFLDRSRSKGGQWFAGDRRTANTVFVVVLVAFVVLTVVATYFRGPNWDWIWPWQALSGHGG
ncbi:MAG: cytochrome bc complex cytochrome b subunit [Acidimicrobiia bacterium]|nr:cytochrome bc complex cytochrome b subunit [Acidimicrobiia bacterium]